MDENGCITKKGIALIASQLKQLIDCAATINESAEKALRDMKNNEYSVHLGYGSYITVKNSYGKWFDIRKFFKPDGCKDPIHTKKGAMINTDEFEKFVSIIPKILEHFPELQNVQACDCMFQGNQMAYFQCRACNPFDAKYYLENY